MQNIYDRAFEGGKSFDRFLEEVEANRELWHAMADRLARSGEAPDRAEPAPGRWRLLVLADDWCGDAINTLPVISRLARASMGIELRIVPRDRYPELRDCHLTNGSQSIPIVLLLDPEGVPRGSWGPRPGPLQERFERELRALPSEARYRELRKWYARDRGETTAREVTEMVERATRGEKLLTGRPCLEGRAA